MVSALERHALAPDDVAAEPTLRALPDVEKLLAYHSWRRHLKRATDLAIVVLTLPLVLPLIVAIASAVKVASRGPVLFRQERIGQGGEPFEMLKFRTMFVDAGERLTADPELFERYVRNDFKLTAEEDPRIAPLGRFLRRTSLDELPQVFNVVRGQMSLVGPRPIVSGELARYGRYACAYLEVKPGITGRWQCDGRNHIRYPVRAQLDAEYLDQWTLRADFVILLKTIPRVLRRHGSH